MERDPERIPEILEDLKQLWEIFPNQRLCQLLSNIAKMSGRENPDLFYFEDSELSKEIKQLLKRGGR